jgi:hypothetical protein
MVNSLLNDIRELRVFSPLARLIMNCQALDSTNQFCPLDGLSSKTVRKSLHTCGILTLSSYLLEQKTLPRALYYCLLFGFPAG